MERELDKELRNAFERVYMRSWYIEGVEDENFEKHLLSIVGKLLCWYRKWVRCFDVCVKGIGNRCRG